jgi:hypothetical protein
MHSSRNSGEWPLQARGLFKPLSLSGFWADFFSNLLFAPAVS